MGKDNRNKNKYILKIVEDVHSKKVVKEIEIPIEEYPVKAGNNFKEENEKG